MLYESLTKKVFASIRAPWHFFVSVIKTVERRSLSAHAFFATFFAIIVIRLVEQWWIGGFKVESFVDTALRSAEMVFAFLFVLMALVFVWRLILQLPLHNVLPVLLTGMPIILIAPLFDLVYKGEIISYYEITNIPGLMLSFFTVFGQTPQTGITIGYRLEIIFSVIFAVLYARVHTKKFYRIFLVALGTYSVFFAVSALISLVGILVIGVTKGFFSVTHIDIATLFMAPQDVLVHRNTSMRQAFFFYVDMVYIPIVSALAIFFVYKHLPKIWELLKRSIAYHVIILYIFACILGFVSAAMLVGKHISDLITSNLFAGIMGITLIIIGFFYGTASSISTSHRELLPVRFVLYASSIFFSTLIHPISGVLVLSAYALRVVRSYNPLCLANLPIVAQILAAAELCVLALFGASVLSTDSMRIFANNAIMICIFCTFGMLIVTYNTLMQNKIFASSHREKSNAVVRREMVALGLAVAWFFVYLLSISILNTYGIALPIAILCASITSIVLWYSISCPKISQKTAFTIVQGISISYTTGLFVALSYVL